MEVRIRETQRGTSCDGGRQNCASARESGDGVEEAFAVTALESEGREVDVEERRGLEANV